MNKSNQTELNQSDTSDYVVYGGFYLSLFLLFRFSNLADRLVGLVCCRFVSFPYQNAKRYNYDREKRIISMISIRAQ